MQLEWPAEAPPLLHRLARLLLSIASLSLPSDWSWLRVGVPLLALLHMPRRMDTLLISRPASAVLFSEDSYTLLPDARSCSCRGTWVEFSFTFQKKKRSTESTSSTGLEDWWLVFFFLLSFSIWFRCSGSLERAPLRLSNVKHTRGNHKWSCYTLTDFTSIYSSEAPPKSTSRRPGRSSEAWIHPSHHPGIFHHPLCLFAFISSYHPLCSLCRHADAADLTAECGRWYQSVSLLLVTVEFIWVQASHWGIIVIAMSVTSISPLVGVCAQTLGTTKSKVR